MSCGFHSILVGDDGSPENQSAVDAALSLAECCKAKVVLLGVIEPLTAEQQAEGYSLKHSEDENAQLRNRVEQTAANAKARGVDVLAEVTRGEPEKEIKQFVQEHAIDLLVLGHRDISRPRRWLEGSTSEDLAHALNVSVLIVHGNTK